MSASAAKQVLVGAPSFRFGRQASVEVATGYEGTGIFLTMIGPLGGRNWTVGMLPDQADAVADLLTLAAKASRANAKAGR